MVSINYSAREVCCKIVYYGPGLSGKTTNLQYVHEKVPGNSRGDLISLATEADRTLYFDFLPINIGTINGFQAKFQLYTVPGQVYYNATRKLVLRGVDGIVFVADSQPDKMDDNIESLMNLEENLVEFGYNIDTIPMVIQYNKRDLPNVMAVEELQAKLNSKGRPHFEASATVGNGIFGTLKLIIKLVLDKAKQSSSSTSPTASAVEAQESVPPETSVPVATAAPVTSSEERVSATTVEAAKPTPIAPAAEPSRTAVASEPAQPVGESVPSASFEPRPVVAEPAPEQVALAAVKQPSSEPALRPFPGSQRENKSEQRVSPSRAPAAMEELDQSSLSENVESEGQSPDQVSHHVGLRPQMAPSLKRQESKKRGFFKRLFGIK